MYANQMYKILKLKYIFSGLTQKYNWTYPIPSPVDGTSDDYKEGVWPDSNMKM